MDVSPKLHRLFLPIVIIGALGIGIIDSVLTPSPVLAAEFNAHYHNCDLDRRNFVQNCDSGDEMGKEKTAGFLILLLIPPIYIIRTLFKDHPVFTTPSGETYPNPWNLPAVLGLGVSIAGLCMILYLIVFTLQGKAS